MDGKIYLTKEYIGQSHSECIRCADLGVTLVNSGTGEQTQIIGKDGSICNFPGIEACEDLQSELDIDRIPPVVRYSAAFRNCEDGRHLMIWTVRPDGRYWMDSWGFGTEDYEWVDLYAYIDENGRFTAPFRLHSIGYRKFFEETRG